MYWLATFAVIVLFWLNLEPIGVRAIGGEDIVEDMLFLPHYRADGDLYPILDVGWTLNYEMYFYALFGLTCFLRSQVLALTALTGWFLIGGLIRTLGPQLPHALDFYFEPITLEFAAGGLLALLYRRELPAAAAPSMRYLGFALLVGGIVAMLGDAVLWGEYVNWNVTLRTMAFGGPAVMIVAGALLLERVGVVWRSPTLLLLGAASYSIYLIYQLALQYTNCADCRAVAVARCRQPCHYRNRRLRSRDPCRRRHASLAREAGDGVAPRHRPAQARTAGGAERSDLMGAVSNIQVLRAFAALAVAWRDMLMWFGSDPGWGLLHVGRAGVDVFFVISGFIMFHTTQDGGRTTAQFWTDRVVRIAPLYWLMTLLIVGLYLAGLPAGDVRQLDGNDVPLALAFIPNYRGDEDWNPILATGWTLIYEMYFYFLFGLTFFLRSQVKALTLLTVFFVAFFAVSQLVNLPFTLSRWAQPITLEFAAGGLSPCSIATGSLTAISAKAAAMA